FRLGLKHAFQAVGIAMVEQDDSRRRLDRFDFFQNRDIFRSGCFDVEQNNVRLQFGNLLFQVAGVDSGAEHVKLWELVQPQHESDETDAVVLNNENLDALIHVSRAPGPRDHQLSCLLFSVTRVSRKKLKARLRSTRVYNLGLQMGIHQAYDAHTGPYPDMLMAHSVSALSSRSNWRRT